MVNSQVQVSLWETGKTAPTAEQMKRLRAALGGASAAEAAAKTEDTGRVRTASARKAVQPAAQSGKAVSVKRTNGEVVRKLTFGQLERHLFAAADILRGKMDPSSRSTSSGCSF